MISYLRQQINFVIKETWCWLFDSGSRVTKKQQTILRKPFLILTFVSFLFYKIGNYEEYDIKKDRLYLWNTMHDSTNNFKIYIYKNLNDANYIFCRHNFISVIRVIVQSFHHTFSDNKQKQWIFCKNKVACQC